MNTNGVHHRPRQLAPPDTMPPAPAFVPHEPPLWPGFVPFLGFVVAGIVLAVLLTK